MSQGCEVRGQGKEGGGGVNERKGYGQKMEGQDRRTMEKARVEWGGWVGGMGVQGHLCR